MTVEELDALIASIAAGDKTITRDGTTLTAHDLGDLIKYREALVGQVTATSGVPSFGLRFTKLIPDGCG